jgi:putative transposase
MRSDETLHPGRKSLRLPFRDYSAPGTYFVTICAENNRCIFGQVEKACVQLTPLGEVVRECWVGIPVHYLNAKLHPFIVMPNHLHGLIELVPTTGKPRLEIRPRAFDPSGVPPGSLSAIVRSFKAIVTKRAHKEIRLTEEIWHRNYFERVVRDGEEFSNATRYIAENPQRWEWDTRNPQAVKIQ